MADPVAAQVIKSGAITYFAPEGETPPDPSAVDYGVAWGGNWERVGFTKTPLVVVYEFDELEIEVEEELAAIDRIKTAERMRLEVTLAELTADYLALATSGTATTTAPGVGQVGVEELVLGGAVDLDKYAWGFEGRFLSAAGAEFPIRFFVWRGTARLNGNLEFSKKSGEYSGIPLQVKALTDVSQAAGEKLGKFQRVTAPAT